GVAQRICKRLAERLHGNDLAAGKPRGQFFHARAIGNCCDQVESHDAYLTTLRGPCYRAIWERWFVPCGTRAPLGAPITTVTGPSRSNAPTDPSASSWRGTPIGPGGSSGTARVLMLRS